jgi:plasmid stabilization system protein ParE
MAKKKVEIVWSNQATGNFIKILEYLSTQSNSTMNMVGNSILDEIDRLAKNPYVHPVDRFKKKNDNHFRACVVFSYRISYHVSENQINILRIRHTSREPLEF